jgi:hypothetical protein
MILRRREISATVTQESLRDNNPEVPCAEYAKSCIHPLEYRFDTIHGRIAGENQFAMVTDHNHRA